MGTFSVVLLHPSKGDNAVSILWIIIVVLVVLALLGFVGRGRW
jgi:flagellar basal body-associated protein FliL